MCNGVGGAGAAGAAGNAGAAGTAGTAGAGTAGAGTAQADRSVVANDQMTQLLDQFRRSLQASGVTIQ